MKKLIAQFMKFGIVGVIAFVIDYGVMIFLTEVFGVPYLISTTISFCRFGYFQLLRFDALRVQAQRRYESQARIHHLYRAFCLRFGHQ